jgi:hypothetical protein
MIQTVWDIALLSTLLTMVFIVCGASPTQHVYQTYVAAVYFVTCTFFQYPSILDATIVTMLSVKDVAEDENDNNTRSNGDENSVMNEGKMKMKVHRQHYSNYNPTYTSIRIQQLVSLIVRQIHGQSAGIVDVEDTPASSSTYHSSDQMRMRIETKTVLHQTIVYGCTITTILFQILRLFDHGYQIQRYPIPIIFGCTIGWMLGTWIGMIRCFFVLKRYC